MRLVLAAVLLAAFGCASTKTAGGPTTRARFFLESTDPRSVAVALPRSGVRIAVGAQPVITEADIANVELAQVELGRCLMFQLTPAAARDLYRISASHQGSRLVLVIDGAPLGARRIERPLADGTILVFAEVPDAALPELVANLRRSAVALQRDLAHSN